MSLMLFGSVGSAVVSQAYRESRFLTPNEGCAGRILSIISTPNRVIAFRRRSIAEPTETHDGQGQLTRFSEGTAVCRTFGGIPAIKWLPTWHKNLFQIGSIILFCQRVLRAPRSHWSHSYQRGDPTEKELCEESRPGARTVRYSITRLEAYELVCSEISIRDARQNTYSIVADDPTEDLPPE